MLVVAEVVVVVVAGGVEEDTLDGGAPVTKVGTLRKAGTSRIESSSLLAPTLPTLLSLACIADKLFKMRSMIVVGFSVVNAFVVRTISSSFFLGGGGIFNIAVSVGETFASGLAVVVDIDDIELIIRSSIDPVGWFVASPALTLCKNEFDNRIG